MASAFRHLLSIHMEAILISCRSSSEHEPQYCRCSMHLVVLDRVPRRVAFSALCERWGVISPRRNADGRRRYADGSLCGWAASRWRLAEGGLGDSSCHHVSGELPRHRKGGAPCSAVGPPPPKSAAEAEAEAAESRDAPGSRGAGRSMADDRPTRPPGHALEPPSGPPDGFRARNARPRGPPQKLFAPAPRQRPARGRRRVAQRSRRTGGAGGETANQ